MEDQNFLEMFETFYDLFRQRYSYPVKTALKWKYQGYKEKSFLINRGKQLEKYGEYQKNHCLIIILSYSTSRNAEC
jgi:hypothetical protein